MALTKALSTCKELYVIRKYSLEYERNTISKTNKYSHKPQIPSKPIFKMNATSHYFYWAHMGSSSQDQTFPICIVTALAVAFIALIITKLFFTPGQAPVRNEEQLGNASPSPPAPAPACISPFQGGEPARCGEKGLLPPVRYSFLNIVLVTARNYLREYKTSALNVMATLYLYKWTVGILISL